MWKRANVLPLGEPRGRTRRIYILGGGWGGGRVMMMILTEFKRSSSSWWWCGGLIQSTAWVLKNKHLEKCAMISLDLDICVHI